MNIPSLCTKALGVVTSGLVLYDAHKSGAMTSEAYSKTNTANRLADQYIQSNMISKASSVEANAKKTWFRLVMDNNLKEAFDSVVGYVKGFCTSVVTDVIPAALATGAILFGNKKAGKLCGLGLMGYGVKYMLYDVMNIGKKSYLD